MEKIEGVRWLPGETGINVFMEPGEFHPGKVISVSNGLKTNLRLCPTLKTINARTAVESTITFKWILVFFIRMK